MADVKYSGVNRGEDTRYKVNNNILRMMNTNPALGIGYLIGNALGENYWGKKRAKASQDAHNNTMNGIGADEKNGVKGVPESAGNKSNDYYASMNKAFDEYRNGNNGRVLYEGRNSNAPRTPQQNNTSGVTVGNVDNGGGVTSVADAWNKMANGSGYNTGNTTMFTNGARNLGNVIGADANGEFGRMAGLHPGVIIDTARGIYPAARPGTYIDTSRGIYMDSSQNTPAGGSAPSAANIPRSPQTKAPNPNPTPIPYTAEQLAQIQAYGGFTPEELRRMGAAELIAPVTQAVAPAQSGGILTSAAERYAPATPANIDKIIAGDDEIYERGNPFAGQSTPLPVSHRGTRAMAAAWQQDPNIMNAASSTPVAPPQLVYPNDVDEKYYLELLANAQHGD